MNMVDLEFLDSCDKCGVVYDVNKVEIYTYVNEEENYEKKYRVCPVCKYRDEIWVV